MRWSADILTMFGRTMIFRKKRTNRSRKKEIERIEELENTREKREEDGMRKLPSDRKMREN